jgi:hypothetical protein
MYWLHIKDSDNKIFEMPAVQPMSAKQDPCNSVFKKESLH